MITLEQDRLVSRFPEVHEDAICSIQLQRTLRIPDDGKNYPLPPGLGALPLRHVDDFAERVPQQWCKRGGVITGMYQAEAMWLRFSAGEGNWGIPYPFAVKVATGKVNAVSGEPWREHLNQDPQDYMVLPRQPWLDGYCVEKGVIRQFVAMPLGGGYTVEEQLTESDEYGGLQIVVWPMKAERYERLVEAERNGFFERAALRRTKPLPDAVACEMGLAPGGRMRQEIYADPHGIGEWDQRHASRCFLTITNASQWMAITDERPPAEPPTAEEYARHGLPWFDYYDGDAKAIEGAERLKKIKSVREMAEKEGSECWPATKLSHKPRVRRLRPRFSRRVREERF